MYIYICRHRLQGEINKGFDKGSFILPTSTMTKSIGLKLRSLLCFDLYSFFLRLFSIGCLVTVFLFFSCCLWCCSLFAAASCFFREIASLLALAALHLESSVFCFFQLWEFSCISQNTQIEDGKVVRLCTAPLKAYAPICHETHSFLAESSDEIDRGKETSGNDMCFVTGMTGQWCTDHCAPTMYRQAFVAAVIVPWQGVGCHICMTVRLPVQQWRDIALSLKSEYPLSTTPI